jgi:hypothetical protein
LWWYLGGSGSYPKLNGFSSQFDYAERLANLADIDASGALGFAGEAGCTQPGSSRVEHLLEADLQISDDLMW